MVLAAPSNSFKFKQLGGELYIPSSHLSTPIFSLQPGTFTQQGISFGFIFFNILSHLSNSSSKLGVFRDRYNEGSDL